VTENNFPRLLRKSYTEDSWRKSNPRLFSCETDATSYTFFLLFVLLSEHTPACSCAHDATPPLLFAMQCGYWSSSVWRRQRPLRAASSLLFSVVASRTNVVFALNVQLYGQPLQSSDSKLASYTCTKPHNCSVRTIQTLQWGKSSGINGTL